MDPQTHTGDRLVATAQNLRWDVGAGFHDVLIESIYTDAANIADRAVHRSGQRSRFDLDRTLDRLVTSRWTGYPIMFLLLAGVMWLTVVGANYPSELIASVLLDRVHPALKAMALGAGAPGWLLGVLIDGGYLALAWVVSVMLPPMAIFFPLFTLLEDFGYLPRVAFNLDGLFQLAGAHGKQALTMSMGFGCNAAGVIASRVIDSPRERLNAVITNNFALCNGRWPTQILRTLYTSLIDRTIFVLWRAMVFAFPAGAVIWLVANVHVGGATLAERLIAWLDPLGLAIGLNGIILLAYVVAIPANEIVIPTVLMLTVITAGLDNVGAGQGVIFDAGSASATGGILRAGGWTVLTGLSLMLFSLVHNPCSTTLFTIWKETGSARWTWVAALLPLVMGFALCFALTWIWTAVAG